MTTSRGILAKSLSGRGFFFTGRRCEILVMMGIPGLVWRRGRKVWFSRLVQQKNSSRENHELNEFGP